MTILACRKLRLIDVSHIFKITGLTFWSKASIPCSWLVFSHFCNDFGSLYRYFPASETTGIYKFFTISYGGQLISLFQLLLMTINCTKLIHKLVKHLPRLIVEQGYQQRKLFAFGNLFLKNFAQEFLTLLWCRRATS